MLLPRVYPRPCGEARSGGLFLGPRLTDGSIPARAGKPRRVLNREGTRMQVYPRPCGEADGRDSPAPGPRRSIPARAGKPPLDPRRCRGHIDARAVDGSIPERPCGEAVELSSRTESLSPPVRGSHYFVRRLRYEPGSIPARAGKPQIRLQQAGFA